MLSVLRGGTLVWCGFRGKAKVCRNMPAGRANLPMTGLHSVTSSTTGLGPQRAITGLAGSLLRWTRWEFIANLKVLEQLRHEAGDNGYDYEVVENPTLAESLPGIGPEVPGATYCPHDGHVNPLRLLRALQEGFDLNGGTYLPRSHIDRIRPLDSGGFELFSGARLVAGCERLVIAAGHGSSDLGAQLRLSVPVFPVQGQIVVTERSPNILGYPTNYVRQTDEGNFMLGPSARDAGFDLDTKTSTLQDIVRQCARAFPYLRDLRIQRTWAALRIMTPDGFLFMRNPRSFPVRFLFPVIAALLWRRYMRTKFPSGCSMVRYRLLINALV